MNAPLIPRSPSRLLAVAALVLLAPVAFGQTTLSWRSEAANGNWSDANNWWNGGGTQSPAGSEILQFDNGVQLTMSNDLSGGATNRYRILFNSGSGARTITGTAENSFYDFSSNGPKIENNSSSPQTLNFPLAVGYSFLEYNPVNSHLTNLAGLQLGANQLRVYGNNGNALVFGSGSVISGSGTVALNQNSVLTYNSAHSYTGDTYVNAGTLQLNAGAIPGRGTLQLGDTSGSASATIAVAPPGGGLTVTNPIVARSGSSGILLIDAQNTSSTHTLSGPLTLNKDATLSVASNGFLTVSGSISGAGNLGKTNMGTLTLSASNSLSGTLNIGDGILALSHNNALGTSPGIVVTTRRGGSGLTGTRVTFNGTSFSGYSLSLAATNGVDYRSTVYAGSGSNYWGGPITLNGSGIINLAAEPAGTVLNFGGNISGPSFSGTLFARGGNGNGYIGGVISMGSATLAKADNSTWTISSTGNVWGNTSCSVGILRLGANNALPTNSTVTVGQNPVGIGGTLDLAGFNQQVGGLTIGSTNASLQVIGNSSTTSDSTLTFRGGTSTFGGSLRDIVGSGTRKLNLAVESGVLTLTNNINTYSGGSTITNATLKLGQTNALSPNSALLVQSNGMLDLAGFDAVATAITLQAGASNRSSVGTNALTLTTSGKAIDFTSSGTSYPGSFEFKLTSAAGGEITLTNGVNSVTLNAAIDLGATNRVFNVADVASGSDLFMNGDLKGTGGIVKTGAGTLKLDGFSPKTYTGDTEVQQGTVTIQTKIEMMGDTTQLKVTGGTFTLSTATDTVAQVFLSAGSITGGAGSLLNATNFIFQSGTVSALLGDKLGTLATVNKTGSGTVNISGAHTYSGDTIISAGSLKLAGSATIPDGAGKGNVIVTNTGIFDLASQAETINGLSGNGTVDNTSGTGTYTLIVGNNDAGGVFSGNIKNTSGTLVLRKVGTNSLTLSGSNSFTGTLIVNTGAVVVANSFALGSGSKQIDLAQSGTAGRPQLRFDGSAGPLNIPSNITFRVSNNLGVMFNDAGSNTVNGAITLTGGGGDSAIVVNAGSLALAGSLAPDTTTRNLLLQGTATGYITGAISDGGGANVLSSVQKSGTGIWVLSGTNTYVNGTTVSAGKLVGVSVGSSQSAFTVASGATNGIQVAAANGQWSCKGMTFNSGTTYLDFDLGSLALSASTAPLLVNGNLAFNGTTRVTLRAGSTTAGMYPLIAYTGTTSGTEPTATYSLSLPNLPHASGVLSNDVSGKVIYLVLSANQPLYWATGSGTWDINTTANWKDAAGATTKYFQNSVPGDDVIFEDAQSGTSPITVTLNTTLSPASVTISNSTKSYTFSGAGGVAGSTGFNKQGSGTVTLLNPGNTWSGSTVIGGGVLQVGNGGANGSLPDVGVVNDGTLTINSSNNFTLSQVISGSGSLRKQSDGLLTLSGNNTFAGAVSTGTGTPTSGGILRLLSSYALGDGSTAKTVSVIRAEVRLDGGITIPAGITLETSSNPDVTGPGSNYFALRSVAGTNTVAGPVRVIGGAGASEYTVDAGRLVMNGNILLASNTTTRAAVFSGAGDGVVNGVLGEEFTSPLNLEKKGAGTWTLTASNTLTGTAIVRAGTLALADDGSIGGCSSITLSVTNATLDASARTDGTVTVPAAQTLKGIGLVKGSAVSSGRIEPGNSGIGTLSFDGNLTLAGTTAMDINRTASPKSDKLAGAATITIGGSLVVTNLGATLQVGDTFDLFDGTLGGAFASTNLPHGIAHWITSGLNVGGSITFTNTAPVAADLVGGIERGGSVTLAILGGKHGATDAEGDTLTVTGVSTPTSGSASFTASNVTYVASGSTGTNTFTYTVQDGFGGAVTRTVTVIVSEPQGFNQISAVNLGGNTVALSYLGIPGTNYALDWATNLVAPVWVPVITNAAETNGWLYFTNTGSGTDFYRTRYVP